MDEVKSYAVVEGGLVINVILWDGVTPWAAPDGAEAMEVPSGIVVGPGYTWADGVFAAPPPPPVVPPTAAEILSANTSTRNTLLDAAARAIAPLQDADDLGVATAADTAALKAWKQFRVAVNRIDLTQLNPAWPSAPQPGYVM